MPKKSNGFIIMSPRSSNELFNDLINLTADKWNSRLSDELGIDVELLRNSVTGKEALTINEDRIHLSMQRNKIPESMDSKGEFVPTKLTKYVLRGHDGVARIKSISCTGKVLVGIDFSGSDLPDSYFCDCVFFNCDLSNIKLRNATFINCVINGTFLNDTDLTGSIFIRTRILDSNLSNIILDDSIITDCMLIGNQMLHSSFHRSRILSSGLIDCFVSNSSYEEASLIGSSITHSNCVDCNMNGIKLIDSIFISTDFSGCKFKYSTITCITASDIICDGDIKSIFEMSRALYSPSMFEWDDIEAGTHPDLNNDPDGDGYEGTSTI